MKLESHLDQCNPDKMEQLDGDGGYLMYYQEAERFFLIAIYSHGAKNCSEATTKDKMTFFTRLDIPSTQKHINTKRGLHRFVDPQPYLRFKLIP